MHATVLGPPEAPDVVCVHGLGCSHRYFGPLARQLSGGYHVVAVDLPGFGRTPGPPETLDVRGLSTALADWLRATGRGGVPLVANSAGCQVVADLAVHASELLGPAVLNAPTMDRHARDPLPQIARLLSDVPRERPGWGLVIGREYLDCETRRLLATFRFLLADPIERKLARLATPCVVVRGGRDPIVSREWVQECVSLLPQGTLAEVAGAGHTLNYSAPAALARIIHALLDRTGDFG
ncbi:alpha/beta fold hydrolase [Haloactinomyces albus]|uniref:Pimeloyl-ACP methyl ester carboxylesterase n=1 Tax=Haloactinomyces albus TaxID=1352928 RepID=A0AAE4CJV2_9ACTN|nr:alpha/beta hydrolase [Haloactinomyces albus]MDR7300099.1 pimeloyl-ACP methyl ester carboxylesterase [Haloactinomyces albus]